MPQLGMAEFIVLCPLGLLIGLANVQLDDKEKISFGYWSILWTFIMAMAVGLYAGECLGNRTIQTGGGRDPEYETVEVRKVADGERWQRAEAVSNRAFLPLALGLGGSAGWIRLLRARQQNWTRRRIQQFRSNAVLILTVVLILPLRFILEG